MLGRFWVAMIVNNFICKIALMLLFKARCRNCGTLLDIFPPTFQYTLLQVRFPEKPWHASAVGSLFQLLVCPQVPDLIFIRELSHIPAALSNLPKSCLLSVVAEKHETLLLFEVGCWGSPVQTQPLSARAEQHGNLKKMGDNQVLLFMQLVPCGSCP